MHSHFTYPRINHSIQTGHQHSLYPSDQVLRKPLKTTSSVSSGNFTDCKNSNRQLPPPSPPSLHCLTRDPHKVTKTITQSLYNRDVGKVQKLMRAARVREGFSKLKTKPPNYTQPKMGFKSYNSHSSHVLQPVRRRASSPRPKPNSKEKPSFHQQRDIQQRQ